MSVQFWVLVVLHNLYWQRHCVPDSIHFRRHKQNSSICVVTCGAIAEKMAALYGWTIFITRQFWLKG